MFKNTRIESKKITQHARECACIRCGTNDKTIVARHYNGIRQHLLGKGRGKKAHDLCVAFLCDRCDQEFTEGSVGKNEYVRLEKSEEFMFLCMLTMIKCWRDGVIDET